MKFKKLYKTSTFHFKNVVLYMSYNRLKQLMSYIFVLILSSIILEACWEYTVTLSNFEFKFLNNYHKCLTLRHPILHACTQYVYLLNALDKGAV